MYANALALFLLAWMVVPGLWLAQRPWAVSPKIWFYTLLANLVLFTALGILFKLMPWLIDPRVSL
jgi:hypothetical protein